MAREKIYIRITVKIEVRLEVKRMNFQTAVQFAQECIRNRITEQSIVIDATLGNGYDTLFLCEQVGHQGTIYGFDIQPEALNQTVRTIKQALGHVPSHLHLILENHAAMESRIPIEQQGRIDAIMFNLGYLPGSNHQVTTQTQTSLLALQASLRLLRIGGILTIVIYTGHPGGNEEAQAIEAWSAELTQRHYQVLRYQFTNLMNSPPYLIAIAKK